MPSDRTYLLDDKPIHWTLLIKQAEAEGMQKEGFIPTSEAAKYLRSLGHTVEDNIAASLVNDDAWEGMNS